MYRICVSNSFTRRFTTYKTCLLKRDLNINEPEKRQQKRMTKVITNFLLSFLKYSTSVEVFISINPRIRRRQLQFIMLHCAHRRVTFFRSHYGAERLSHPLTIALRPCVLLFSKGSCTLFNTLAIYTFFFVFFLSFLKQLCKPCNNPTNLT